jgi:hypothetical protein
MANGSIHKAVPKEVLDKIKAHVRGMSKKGEAAWRSASKSEDTITGHWGGNVTHDWSEPIPAEGYQWRFRIDYHKLSNTLEEPEIGGDGVFQIEVERFDVGTTPSGRDTVTLENIEVAATFRKALLFQSKKIDNAHREKLVEQLEDLERLTPSAATYFEYGPDAFLAASAKTVIDLDGLRSKIKAASFARLGDFLADEFLECNHGVEGLYYDFKEDALYFPQSNGDIRRLRVKLKHGIRIRVKAFRMVPFKEVPPKVDWRKGF